MMNTKQTMEGDKHREPIKLSYAGIVAGYDAPLYQIEIVDVLDADSRADLAYEMAELGWEEVEGGLLGWPGDALIRLDDIEANYPSGGLTYMVAFEDEDIRQGGASHD